MKNYASEIKKFATSHYLYAAVRITFAIVIPSMILAHFGLLKEFFLFPLGTSFVGLTDQPGPYIRRRNSLVIACISFLFVASVASLLKGFPAFGVLEIIFFGMFFSLIGVYGQRLNAVGSLSLVVLAIFIDGHLIGHDVFKSLVIFFAGCLWFLFIFTIVSTMQPYKLAGQLIGENYIELGDFLRLKSKYYLQKPDFENLFSQILQQQIKIKNLQEATRETVLKTRTIVNEATTTSRLLMIMFLNSIDLHEQLMTSENDYKKIHEHFGSSGFLPEIHDYLLKLADEITNIGIALQVGGKTQHMYDLSTHLETLQEHYTEMRQKSLNPDTLEHFMILRQIMYRLAEITDEVNSIYLVFTQDLKLAKSLSTKLDYDKFLPEEAKLNFKILVNNLSLKSGHFRHAVRITVALLIGFLLSELKLFPVGHSYWILITILAIMKPAYSITKSRNLLRLYGTLVGGILAYLMLYFIDNNSVLFAIFLVSMILCFTFLRIRYFWAVLFMTVYIFLAFNFVQTGSINQLFLDRTIDTVVGGLIAFVVSYFILPLWEHSQNLDLMKNSARDNYLYFKEVFSSFLDHNFDIENYKIRRKNALIALANLSDNFQRMLSDPKDQQQKLEIVHQYVTTSHLLSAYIASLSQFAKTGEEYPEIDAQRWNEKIVTELQQTINNLGADNHTKPLVRSQDISPNDTIDDLLRKRKEEIEVQITKPNFSRITHLTELKNIRELLVLIYDVAREQRKVSEKIQEYVLTQSTTTVKQ